MERSNSAASRRLSSPRPSTQRQRSNSFPIVEALGCSTPEAQLLLAEGRAAIRKRRACSRRNRSVNDEDTAAFDPRDHLEFLNPSPPLPQPQQQQPVPTEARSCHARIPSDATDKSASTIVPPSVDDQPCTSPPPSSTISDYSANLAQFIKAQLRNIPTYIPGSGPISPCSCPDLSFRSRTPLQSPNRITKRSMDAPKLIQIPPVRPPMRSQFSAWSSTDDETDDDAEPVPAVESHDEVPWSKGSDSASSVLGYYEASNNFSFLLSSTPLEEDEPDTAKGFTFPELSLPQPSSEPHGDLDSPLSGASRPQLTSSSAPSFTSSASTSSYFDCKRPLSLAPDMKDRIIAAVTPPILQGKILTATSPWEGASLANVHDLYIESQHRVRVDGMAFDMQRDFVMPSRIGTPC